MRKGTDDWYVHRLRAMERAEMFVLGHLPVRTEHPMEETDRCVASVA